VRASRQTTFYTGDVNKSATKTPAVTALFWILKLLTTGMGEAASDWLVKRLGTYPAVALGFVVFAIVLVAQLRAPRYHTALYWTTVSMVAVFGTMIADAAHVGLGVPYQVSTLVGLVAVVVVMAAWRWREGTVSLSSVTTGRPEYFYWATVIATFALGTAAGDWTARTLGLRYAGSTFLFLGLFALPALWFAFRRSFGVATFWFAYVITRPLGASVADYLGVSPKRGGLGLGLGGVSVAWAALIAVLIAVAHRLESR